jgi:hypothetical protein
MKNIPMFIHAPVESIRKQYAEFKAIILKRDITNNPNNSRFKLRQNAKKYQRSGR